MRGHHHQAPDHINMLISCSLGRDRSRFWDTGQPKLPTWEPPGAPSPHALFSLWPRGQTEQSEIENLWSLASLRPRDPRLLPLYPFYFPQQDTHPRSVESTHSSLPCPLAQTEHRSSGGTQVLSHPLYFPTPAAWVKLRPSGLIASFFSC